MPDFARFLALTAAVAIAAVGVAAVCLGAWPIIRECGRLPHGQGEMVNRAIGAWTGC